MEFAAATDADANIIQLHIEVLRMSGATWTLSVPHSTQGHEVRKMVAQALPSQVGARIVLHCKDVRLVLNKTLKEQGIVGQMASISCTYVPIEWSSAWRLAKGALDDDNPCDVFALEGLTEVTGIESMKSLGLPETLRKLSVGEIFNESLEHVIWPQSLQSLTLGGMFNQDLQHVSWPRNLQSLTFGAFNQSLQNVTFPDSLRNLTFGAGFNQKLVGVTFPSSLQSLRFGAQFNQSLDHVKFPAGLSNLTFGSSFDQSLEEYVYLPVFKL